MYILFVCTDTHISVLYMDRTEDHLPALPSKSRKPEQSEARKALAEGTTNTKCTTPKLCCCAGPRGFVAEVLGPGCFGGMDSK